MRTIPAEIQAQLDPIEAEVRAVLKHALMTGYQLYWDFPKDGSNGPRFDMGPPKLEVRTFFKRPPDGMKTIDEALKCISDSHYIEIAWYYCQDEDWCLRDGGYQWFWDCSHNYCPW